VVIAESADADLYVNLDECTGKTADNLTLTWQVASAGVVPTVPSGTTVSLTISKDASCPPAGTATVWQPATAPDAAGSASGGYPPTGGSLPVTTVLTALGLNTCPSQQTPLNACAAMTISGTTYTATGSITFDTQLPPAPTLGGVEPGDSALIVSYTAGISGGSTPAATDHYQAQATGPDGLVHLSSSTTATSARIEGLANGETYDVVVYAYNKAGNQSAASNTVAGSPEPVIDFWQAYKSGGGREQGGCGAGSAGDVAPILAASALALALRRRLS
jgi:hypothetical protein